MRILTPAPDLISAVLAEPRLRDRDAAPLLAHKSERREIEIETFSLQHACALRPDQGKTARRLRTVGDRDTEEPGRRQQPIAVIGRGDELEGVRAEARNHARAANGAGIVEPKRLDRPSRLEQRGLARK